MKIDEVSYEEYKKVFEPKIVFDTVDFFELNKYKVEQVHYYVFSDKRKRFGFAVGEQNGNLYAPYSASFSIIEPINKHWDIKMLEDSINVFDEYIRQKTINSIRFVLPPAFYDNKVIPVLQNVLLRCGYTLLWQDLNYAFDLKNIDLETYVDALRPNGRKNLRIAIANDLKLIRCKEEEGKRIAYNIIAINRRERGYPLRMTWEQVRDTVKIIKADFFIVKEKDIDIAAAIVFYVSKNIVQVVYWGSIIEYSSYKPINYLSYKLVNYYKEKGFQYVDVGPSTEHGIPNYGLCDFKESIGCEVSSKCCYEKRI